MTNELNNGTIISVSEKFETQQVAQLAKVSVCIAFEGSNKKSVHEKTISIAKEVQGQIEALNNGPVVSHVAEQVQVWSRRPWNKDGEVLPLQYHSSATFIVEFGDFIKLATWIDELAEVEGISINRITWDLTKETKEQLLTDSRQAAVQKTMQKAKDYALGLGVKVTQVLEIADEGMIKPTANSIRTDYALGQSLARNASGTNDKESIAFKPEAITVSIQVEGRFLAA